MLVISLCEFTCQFYEFEWLNNSAFIKRTEKGGYKMMWFLVGKKKSIHTRFKKKLIFCRLTSHI